MKEMIDFDGAPVFAIPAREGYRGFPPGCEGMLVEGPQGWGGSSARLATAVIWWPPAG